MYARHNYSKFYKDFGDYYPLYKRPIDYTILLPKVRVYKFFNKNNLVLYYIIEAY